MQKLSSETKIDQLSIQLSEYEQLLNVCRQENDAFINIAAHDLKAPVRKLAVLIDRLLLKAKKNANDDLSIYTEKIVSTLAEMDAVVERLSAYAAVEINNIDFSETSLTELVKNVITEHSQLIKSSNAEIIVEGLPNLKINKPQIKTVFKELLDNSLKFIRENDRPKIKIKSSNLTLKEKEIYNLANKSVYHKIEFIDNGIGIREDIVEKIFQPFFRFYGKADFAGSGMGLAIIRKIMKNHQGMIYAMPNEYEGVTMIIIFPETS